VREGACGKRTAATPKPRPQAYLTLHRERPIPVVSALSKTRISPIFQMNEKKALTNIGASISHPAKVTLGHAELSVLVRSR
jgi:hypothetical protein